MQDDISNPYNQLNSVKKLRKQAGLMLERFEAIRTSSAPVTVLHSALNEKQLERIDAYALRAGRCKA